MSKEASSFRLFSFILFKFQLSSLYNILQRLEAIKLFIFHQFIPLQKNLSGHFVGTRSNAIFVLSKVFTALLSQTRRLIHRFIFVSIIYENKHFKNASKKYYQGFDLRQFFNAT